MKNKLKTLIVFTIGLVLGSLITLIIFAKYNQRQFANDYSWKIIEITYLAKSLSLNRNEELLESLEAKLPSFVLAIHKDEQLRDAPDAEFALQRVRDFYKCSKKEIPQEISKILADLPPDQTPACEIKK